jgi:hypothetical protein
LSGVFWPAGRVSISAWLKRYTLLPVSGSRPLRARSSRFALTCTSSASLLLSATDTEASAPSFAVAMLEPLA